MSSEKIWSAVDIKAALAKRHAEDMYFTEVKNGPTQTVRNHSRIDALAMKISWTNFTIIGYEIKVARSDFLRDEKWPTYLPMCNQLYFVVAPGVCEPSEVPEVCGLMMMTSKGGLRTVRKAPWREINPPVEMMKYLLFSYIGPYRRRDAARTRAERFLPSERLELFRKYLDDQEDMKEIGHRVARKLGREIQELRRENGHLKMVCGREDSLASELSAIHHALGVVSYYDSHDRCQKCLDAISAMKKSGKITPEMIKKIDAIQSLSTELMKSIEDTEVVHQEGMEM